MFLIHVFSAVTPRKQPLFSPINLQHRPAVKTPFIVVDMFTILPSTGHDANHIENTSHVIPTQRVHWRTDCCLSMSYNICPIIACTYCGVFIEPLPGSALKHHNIVILMSLVAAFMKSRVEGIMGKVFYNV
jgi:hypothetical protein